jgi:cobalt-zinc-cadmium resistance protein CzcA
LATRKNYDFRYQEAQYSRQNAWIQVQRYQSQLAYYDTVALKQASLLLESGIKNYRAGEIPYLEYLVIRQEATSIRRNYLEALRNYNRSVIEWEGWLEGR